MKQRSGKGGRKSSRRMHVVTPKATTIRPASTRVVVHVPRPTGAPQPKRTNARTNRVGAGSQGRDKETYQWGNGELERKARMAEWTKKNPGRESENPNTREIEYPKEVREQAQRFEAWHQDHADRPHYRNPHRRRRRPRTLEVPGWTPQQFSEKEVEEGERRDKTAKFRDRNKWIIEQRKRRDNDTCQACNFRLTINGVRIIDCHHHEPLSTGEDARITKEDDLVCLCPTCHRIAHTSRPPLTVDKIQAARRSAGLDQ